jgi:hypothetical protein
MDLRAGVTILIAPACSPAGSGPAARADSSARCGFDLDFRGHRHARRQGDELVLHLHLGAIERDARAVNELLARGLAGVVSAPRARSACTAARRDGWRRTTRCRNRVVDPAIS